MLTRGENTGGFGPEFADFYESRGRMAGTYTLVNGNWTWQARQGVKPYLVEIPSGNATEAENVFPPKNVTACTFCP